MLLDSVLLRYAVAAGLLSVAAPAAVHAEGDADASPAAAESSDSTSEAKKPATPPAEKKKPKYPPAAKVLDGTDPVEGLLKLHHSDTKLYVELKSGDFDKDHIVLITIARGIGQTPVLGGFSWGFGDDWVWRFRKVGDQVHVVRRNVRFRAKPGTPSAEAVKLAYTDSVLFSLPIATRTSGGAYVVDLTPVFFSDLPQISQVLPGFSFSKKRSTFLEPKGYERNVEVQVAATYASGGYTYIESVPDSRAATINVHYSISRLPKNDYKPRRADDRIGYFLTAIKDFSEPDDTDRFVRYINRWDLRKADPSADISTPKKPIKFWLEKTIPFKYRKPIRDGIEEWNLAFEKAGFYDAIDVDQQPDSADWDPGDINYNTFRWITASAGFAMGPSRVNPLTGQILDADIIFDADFLQYWKREYETFTPKGIEVMTGGPIEIGAYRAEQERLPAALRGGHTSRCSCNLLGGMSQQLAFGATVAASRKRSPEELERLVNEGLKEVTMHEVGHTLGLRHNFKASSVYSIEQLQDPDHTAEHGIGTSVMDYNPSLIMPEGVEQGLYYMPTIGAYDYWAIEYGYKPLKKEKEGLATIAARSGEPELVFGTDEDTRGIDPDPHSRRYDLSSDLIAFARMQANLVAEALPGVVDDLVDEGDSYGRARRAFGILISTHGRAMFDASRYLGGVFVSRSHKGDADAAEPFEVVDVQKQREALTLLEEQMFSQAPFDVPPEIYNRLAPTKWRHWGTTGSDRPDYPAQQVILLWQQRVLDRVMASLTLQRINDNELKTPTDQDALTTAELLGRLTGSLFSEVVDYQEGDYTNRQAFISPLRRNLQRAYLERLTEIALGEFSLSYLGRREIDVDAPPQDCQTIAFAELGDLKGRIDDLLDDDPELDRYSYAHLRETSSRIQKAIDAELLNLPLRSQYYRDRLRRGRE